MKKYYFLCLVSIFKEPKKYNPFIDPYIKWRFNEMRQESFYYLRLELSFVRIIRYQTLLLFSEFVSIIYGIVFINNHIISKCLIVKIILFFRPKDKEQL